MHGMNTKIYYIKNQLHATLAVLFISTCKSTLHISSKGVQGRFSTSHSEVDNRPWTSLLDIHHPDP